MKRRIKKVMEEYKMNELKGGRPEPPAQQDKQKKNYIYESRHLHASRRLRGKDGKFLASNHSPIQHVPNTNVSRRRRNGEENLKIKLVKTITPPAYLSDELSLLRLIMVVYVINYTR